MKQWLWVVLAILACCDGQFRFSSDSGLPFDGGNSCLCSGLFPLCTATGRCVECLAHSDCPGSVCDVVSGRCAVTCDKDSDCNLATFPQACSDDSGFKICTACKDNGDCPRTSPVCSVGRGACVQCLQDAHCSGAAPVCDITQGVCAN